MVPVLQHLYVQLLPLIQVEWCGSGVQPIRWITFEFPLNHILGRRELSQSGDFTLRLPSNQILRHREFSQSGDFIFELSCNQILKRRLFCQSSSWSMESQPLGFLEGSSWGN
jgi:hypothetical protein